MRVEKPTKRAPAQGTLCDMCGGPAVHDYGVDGAECDSCQEASLSDVFDDDDWSDWD